MAQVDAFIPEISDISHFVKPNVRLMFVPDIGYTMFDADLRQSDAQIVAWEAGAENLKAIFRSGENIHRQNAKDIYQLMHREPTKNEYQMAKHGVHASNFGASPRTMAHKLDMTIHQASSFQARWFTLHPEIRAWQKRVEMELMQTRTTRNAFGYREIWFDRVEGLLPEALAWTPQSTTVNVIDKGINNMDENLPEVMLLLQVHDSAIGQFKNSLYPTIRKQIHDHMLITIPYEDPLIIEVDIACSRSSWGACEKVPLEDEHKICPY